MPARKGGSKASASKVSLKVSTESVPDFEGALSAFVFDTNGRLLASAPVRGGAVTLPVSEAQVLKGRVFFGPAPEGDDLVPTLQLMERLRAYEPVLRAGRGGGLVDLVRIPSDLLRLWPFCFCHVRGRVVRAIDGPNGHEERPVCGARVHICEVDAIPRFVLRLPDRDLLRLRDDLIGVIRFPRPIPRPPEPDPPPFLFRFDPDIAGLNPQPLPPAPGDPLRGAVGSRRLDPGAAVGLNPQPLPPRTTDVVGFDPQPDPPAGLLSRTARSGVSLPAVSALRRTGGIGAALAPEVAAALTSASVTQVRSALLANVHLLRPYLCFWPWWWGWFRCDEIRVLETDAFGRFETLIFYLCAGDKPDLYFWVEFQLGGVWETVYHPPIPCNTWWNYACGTEVTIRITDERVPVCDTEPDLPGCQVAVLSIGNNVSISEIQGAGAGVAEGLTTDGRPFGGTLEPHVWFSRDCLINQKGITHYRWSFRRLTGPDGVTPNVGSWTIMTRKVGRHYSMLDPVTGNPVFPFHDLGPDPLAPVGNLFQIKPLDPPPPGIDWEVLDAREDTATAFFETAGLSGGNAAAAAGKYEIKLELFKSNASLVDWTAEGVDLTIADVPAPFGTNPVTTVAAPAYYRILDPGTGHLMGYRMVVRVDNNPCRAEIQAITGTGLTVDANCGFVEYTAGATVDLVFEAEHPNNFAVFGFSVRRGLGIPIPPAAASGKVGDSPVSGYVLSGAFTYSKTLSVSTLLTVNTPPGQTPCAQAAFAEVLDVDALATDGWSHHLTHLDRSDVAAFALATPCECD